MAKCIYMGFAVGHDPQFGINYKNITKKITRLNWRKKAIVRDGHYIFIKKGEYTDDKNKRIKRYFIDGCSDKKGFKREHKYLKSAISIANNYSKKEGKWPKEFEPGYTIFTKNKTGYMRKIAKFKLFKK